MTKKNDVKNILLIGNVISILPLYDFKNRKIKWKTSQLFWKIFLACFIAYHAYTSAIAQISTIVENSRVIYLITVTIITVFAFCSNLLSMISCSLIFQNSYIELLVTLQEIQREKSRNYYLILQYLSSFILIIAVTIELFYSYEGGVSNAIYSIIQEVLSIFIYHTNLNIFLTFTKIIKNVTEYLNELLVDFKPKSTETLNEIIFIYNNLYRAVKLFNKIFGWSVLTFLPILILDIVTVIELKTLNVDASSEINSYVNITHDCVSCLLKILLL